MNELPDLSALTFEQASALQAIVDEAMIGFTHLQADYAVRLRQAAVGSAYEAETKGHIERVKRHQDMASRFRLAAHSRCRQAQREARRAA